MIDDLILRILRKTELADFRAVAGTRENEESIAMSGNKMKFISNTVHKPVIGRPLLSTARGTKSSFMAKKLKSCAAFD